jgi:hypothetical protein
METLPGTVKHYFNEFVVAIVRNALAYSFLEKYHPPLSGNK